MASRQTRDTIHLAVLFLSLLVMLVLLYAGGMAEVVIFAALLAYVLDPLVTAIEQRGFSRATSTGFVTLVLIAAATVFWWTMVPLVIGQVYAMQAGSASEPAMKAILRLQDLIRSRFGFIGLAEYDLIAQLTEVKVKLIQKIPDFLLQGSLSFLIGVVMTPLIMFFFLKDGRQMKKYFIGLVPNRYFEFSLDLLYKMDTQLGNYLRGQFLDAVIFGMLATAVLWLLGIPYFLFIGIFAGLANLIPFVGPIVGACAAFGAVVFEQGDVTRGIYALAAFAGLKLVDDLLVQPLAVGKTVNLHPVAVAIGIVVGGQLFGILGMLLVVPVMGFVKVVFEESIDTYRRYRFD